MDKEKFDKAVKIQREIDWLEHNADGRLTLPEKIDCTMAAEAVITSLWMVYESEISEFCETIVKKYKKEREERIEQLRMEFEAL